MGRYSRREGSFATGFKAGSGVIIAVLVILFGVPALGCAGLVAFGCLSLGGAQNRVREIKQKVEKSNNANKRGESNDR